MWIVYINTQNYINTYYTESKLHKIESVSREILYIES